MKYPKRFTPEQASASIRVCTKCDVAQDLDTCFALGKNGRRIRTCKSCVNVYSKEWYSPRKESRAEWERVRAARDRAIAFDHYGNVCTCCGETEPLFLSIDHVNNDGAAHRKAGGKTGIAMVRWLIKNNFPEGFQLHCYNCNCAKGFHGVCPHKRQAIHKVA